MAYVEKYVVPLTTTAGGDATGYTPVVRGKIVNIMYLADGTTPFDATADFTITTEDTAQNLWVESNIAAAKTVAPRQATHDTVGAAALYAAAGTAVRDYIEACGERVKIVVAQGGNVKKGSFTVIVES